MCSFDDDDDEADMNSSYAMVSQVLLSLEDAAVPNSPSRLAADTTTCRENVWHNYDSQSTVNAADLTLTDDNRLVSYRSEANDHQRRDPDETQMVENVDCDETQYVARCCGESLIGLDHTYASVDQTENSVAVSDSSPSLLLHADKLFQLMSSSDNAMQSSVMNAAACVDTAADHVDVETRRQTQQSGVCDDADARPASQAVVCTVSDSPLTVVNNSAEHHVPQSGSSAASDLPVTVRSTAISVHSGADGDDMAMSDDVCTSPLPVTTHMVNCNALPSCASMQVDNCTDCFNSYFLVTICR